MSNVLPPTSPAVLLLAAGGLSRGDAFARSAHLDSVLPPLSCRNKKGGPTEGDPSHQISQKTRIDPHGPMYLNPPLRCLTHRTQLPELLPNGPMYLNRPLRILSFHSSPTALAPPLTRLHPSAGPRPRPTHSDEPSSNNSTPKNTRSTKIPRFT